MTLEITVQVLHNNYIMIIIQMEYPFFFHYKVRSTLYTSLWDIPLRDSDKQNTDKSDKQNAEEGSSRMQSGTDNTFNNA